jgi:hypothetical protein
MPFSANTERAAFSNLRRVATVRLSLRVFLLLADAITGLADATTSDSLFMVGTIVITDDMVKKKFQLFFVNRLWSR